MQATHEPALQVCPVGHGQRAEQPAPQGIPASMTMMPASLPPHVHRPKPEPSAAHACAPPRPSEQTHADVDPGVHARPGEFEHATANSKNNEQDRCFMDPPF